MADKPASQPPSRVHLYALRKIDSAEIGGASRVKRGADFRVDAATGARLEKAGAAIPYADRPKHAR